MWSSYPTMVNSSPWMLAIPRLNSHVNPAGITIQSVAADFAGRESERIISPGEQQLRKTGTTDTFDSYALIRKIETFSQVNGKVGSISGKTP